MKLKNIIYSGLLGTFLFSLAACSLDETPNSYLTEDEAYKDKDFIYVTAVAGLYTEIGADGGGSGLAGTDRGLYDLNVFTADEAVIPTRGADWGDGGLWTSLYQHQWSTTNDLFKSTWEYLFRAVGKCNISLDKMLEKYEQDPENLYLPEYIAEVKAIRALFYYYLLDNYGRVPIVTSSTVLIKDVKQSTRSEVFKFVVSELQTALPDLKTGNSSNQGEYYGRITKSVANFLLAKLALNAQVYSDDNWDKSPSPAGSTSFTIDGQDVGAWEATIKYCDAIIEEGLYSLNADYKANFSVKNESSPENIFVIPMDPNLYKAKNMYLVRTRHYAHGKAFNSQDGWNGASATTDLLRIFRKDAVDPRLEMCFFMGEVLGPDGQPVMDGDNPLVYAPDAVKLITTGEPTEKTAGARWAKYEFDMNALSGGQLVSNDYVLYRFADVLLMKAEALVRAGKAGEADAILKQIRDRVGASERKATLENILDERMLELSWEGFRRQDLVRFGKYNDDVMDRKGSEPYRKVFPIPSNVLDNNPNLTQNPGYGK